jgi:protein arginine kinase activator
MFCEECKKRPATVHIIQVMNNTKTERHLCEQCACEHQGFSISFEPNFTIQQLLTSLLNQDAGVLGLSAPGILTRQQCKQCHLTYPELAQGGKFGCRECYEHFADRLESLMRKIHGNAQHSGKIPQRTGQALGIKRQLEKFNAELQIAIRQEAFEKAAEIRDAIRDLEKGKGE